MYEAGINKVIVKLDPDWTRYGHVLLQESVRNLQITGTVVSVGKVANPKMSKIVSEYTKAYYRELPNPEIEEITPLKKGERVAFSYVSKLDEDSFIDKDLLIIPRGLIFAKGNPLKGINGYLLLQLKEKSQFEMYGKVFKHNDDVNEYGFGFDDSGFWGYNPQTGFRLETDLLNTLNPDGQSSLFVIKKQNAWLISKEKSIAN